MEKKNNPMSCFAHDDIGDDFLSASKPSNMSSDSNLHFKCLQLNAPEQTFKLPENLYLDMPDIGTGFNNELPFFDTDLDFLKSLKHGDSAKEDHGEELLDSIRETSEQPGEVAIGHRNVSTLCAKDQQESTQVNPGHKLLVCSRPGLVLYIVVFACCIFGVLADQTSSTTSITRSSPTLPVMQYSPDVEYRKKHFWTLYEIMSTVGSMITTFLTLALLVVAVWNYKQGHAQLYPKDELITNEEELAGLGRMACQRWRAFFEQEDEEFFKMYISYQQKIAKLNEENGRLKAEVLNLQAEIRQLKSQTKRPRRTLLFAGRRVEHV